MRDRLIELIKDLAEDLVAKCGDECDTCTHGDCVGKVADHLLENGVIVPPCKVGDTVYIIDEVWDETVDPYVLDVKVLQFFINEHGIAVDLELPLGMRQNTWMVVGKNVFLTEEEAEQALARMKGGETDA